MATNFRIALAVAVLVAAPAAFADEPSISASEPVYDAPAAAGAAVPAGVVVEGSQAPAASAQAQVAQWGSETPRSQPAALVDDEQP
jgi:hypothetical protein